MEQKKVAPGELSPKAAAAPAVDWFPARDPARPAGSDSASETDFPERSGEERQSERETGRDAQSQFSFLLNRFGRPVMQQFLQRSGRLVGPAGFEPTTS